VAITPVTVTRRVEVAPGADLRSVEVTSTDAKANALEVAAQNPAATSFSFEMQRQVTVDGEVFTQPAQQLSGRVWLGDEVSADDIPKLHKLPASQRENAAYMASFGVRFAVTARGLQEMGSKDIAVSVLAESLKAAFSG
jgi:hypothetical protein